MQEDLKKSVLWAVSCIMSAESVAACTTSLILQISQLKICMLTLLQGHSVQVGCWHVRDAAKDIISAFAGRESLQNFWT